VLNGDIQEKRTRMEIVAGIINVCRQPATKTRIVYEVNLNFLMLEKYLGKYLLKNGLLKQEGRAFKATVKGEQWLAQFEQVKL